jgi:hypothetical protein
MTVLPEFNIINVRSRQAVVGVSAPQSQREVTRVSRAFEKMRALSAADGWRGRQELNCVSGKFISLIIHSL